MHRGWCAWIRAGPVSRSSWLLAHLPSGSSKPLLCSDTIFISQLFLQSWFPNKVKFPAGGNPVWSQWKLRKAWNQSYSLQRSFAIDFYRTKISLRVLVFYSYTRGEEKEKKKKEHHLEEEGFKHKILSKNKWGRGVPSHLITKWNITFYKYIFLCTFPQATKSKVWKVIFKCFWESENASLPVRVAPMGSTYFSQNKQKYSFPHSGGKATQHSSYSELNSPSFHVLQPKEGVPPPYCFWELPQLHAIP